jgi:hypothetical protein
MLEGNDIKSFTVATTRRKQVSDCSIWNLKNVYYNAAGLETATLKTTEDKYSSTPGRNAGMRHRP